jgi:signal peptidase I
MTLFKKTTRKAGEHERLESASPFRKREFLARKIELFFAREYDLYWGWGRGESMLPTLPAYRSPFLEMPIGEGRHQDVRVGYVVTFIGVKYNGHPAYFHKRIRALAGDVVEFRGKHYTVPEGHFWAVGDNEANSYDSRHFGAVPLSHLRARTLISFSYSFPFVKWISSIYIYEKPGESKT